jgi:hypothetical protein
VNRDATPNRALTASSHAPCVVNHTAKPTLSAPMTIKVSVFAFTVLHGNCVITPCTSMAVIRATQLAP